MTKRHPPLPRLKPRIPELEPRIPMFKPKRKRKSKTLRERQIETGRTLALNGPAWRRLRAAVLAERPLCALCQRQGRVVPATEVDHVDNDPANNDRDNLQSLCKPCHSRKTQADMGKRVDWGCDVFGLPLDPAHPWSQRDELKSLETEREEPRPQSRFVTNRPKAGYHG